MSVETLRAQVMRLRELARADPDTYEPELALALYTLCMELKDIGGPITTSYLELLEEGIALHRRLLGRNPSSIPQLGLMLCWLGFAQYNLGWNAKAQDFLEEGLGLIRSMARAEPDVYESQLAHALDLTSFTLSRVGDHSAALSAARESLAIWRQLAEEQPGEHDYYLAGALHTVCFALRDAERHEEILAPAEESVTIARRLRARGSEGARARLLANSLDLKATALANLERPADALPVMEEAVLSYKEAHRYGHMPDSLNYAIALNNLSKLHMLLGRTPEAKDHAERAFAEFVTRIRRTDALADLPELASDIVEQLMSLGMTWRAKMLARLVNQRLNPQSNGLGKLIARLRRR
ncbi:hypothetical protein EDD27_5303 [Nonomuraea polychroma]|uniref:Tetratricopeptide repeat protein n=1 Tax=Nonomuraea polychroma TaxID=46176 RepID=A0A438MAJ7_9ACTN|nr:tetratricopeptide repeat protein [Nonomuraea polychroma]RVX42665.1 hypothetical protein EDD27_5303 [Nonomuraea polychroma]